MIGKVSFRQVQPIQSRIVTDTPSQTAPKEEGMSTEAKVATGVGALAIAGLAAYALVKRNGKAAAKAAEQAADKVNDAVGQVAENVGNGVKKVADKAKRAVEKAKEKAHFDKLFAGADQESVAANAALKKRFAKYKALPADIRGLNAQKNDLQDIFAVARKHNIELTQFEDDLAGTEINNFYINQLRTKYQLAKNPTPAQYVESKFGREVLNAKAKVGYQADFKKAEREIIADAKRNGIKLTMPELPPYNMSETAKLDALKEQYIAALMKKAA